MQLEKSLVIFAPHPQSFPLADELAQMSGGSVIDPTCLFDDCTLTARLGAEHLFCVASEIALSLARRGSVVLRGPIKLWGVNRRKTGLNVDLFLKLRKMFSSRHIVYVILIPGTTTMVASLDGLPSALRLCAPADAVVITHDEGASASDVAQLGACNGGVPCELFECNQIRIIHNLQSEMTTETKHETVFFDASTPHIVHLSTIPRLCTAPFDAIHAEIKGFDGFALVCLPPRDFDEQIRTGQHLTLRPGFKNGRPRAPALMRVAAKAIERGDEVCCFSEDDVVDLIGLHRRTVQVRPISWAFDAFAPVANQKK